MGAGQSGVVRVDDLFEVRSDVRAAGSMVLALVGELDHLGVEPFDEVLASTWDARPESLTLDLRQLRFINARGLACLLRTSRTAQRRGVPLVLLCVPGLVSRLVVLVGLGDQVAAVPALAIVPAPEESPAPHTAPVLTLVRPPTGTGTGPGAAAAGFVALVQLDVALSVVGADVAATREAIVAHLRTHVPGAEHVTLCGATTRRLSGDATATDPAGATVAALQISAREGPSHDARRLRAPVHAGDLRTDVRWPRFGAAVSRHAARSVLAFPLVHEGELVGVLTVCSDAPGAFDGEARMVAGALAARAATGFGAARIRDGLITAVRSRDVIGQGKGILMARYALSEQQAFALLSQASQDRNQRVVDLAEELARTGDL